MHKKERYNRTEKIKVKLVTNLVKNINLQFQEAQQTPSRMNTKKTTPRHIIVRLLKTKDKEKVLKAAREYQNIIYMG